MIAKLRSKLQPGGICIRRLTHVHQRLRYTVFARGLGLANEQVGFHVPRVPVPEQIVRFPHDDAMISSSLTETPGPWELHWLLELESDRGNRLGGVPVMCIALALLGSCQGGEQNRIDPSSHESFIFWRS